MRRGVSLFGIVVLLTGFAAAAARADGGSGTTTTDTTTTAATTTDTTTTAPTTTTTTPPPAYVPLVRSGLPRGCVGAGVAAIAKHTVVALKRPNSRAGASAYPASHPFLTVDSATKTGSRCLHDRVTLTGVSLFGGAVTATRVVAMDGKGTVTGLEIGGSPVSAKRGQTVGVGGWGLLKLGAAAGRLSAPLALRLIYRHDSVRAGTTIFIGYAAERRQPPREVVTRVVQHHRRHAMHANKPRLPQPLKVTPPLGIRPSHYVFPVDGGASYIDTYGANRNDIYDGWHHGDDLFAPLGTPVVAVANGTISPIGWDMLGGWRLWLTDKKGNSFYYAHLAGYSRFILHHRHVKAGQVLGFLGRTGDAFTTTPHLHFEIHPHQLVRLGYDGAVDPTTYLHSWRVIHLPASKIPAAARLRAPAGTPSQEAAVVWRELLKARHLMPDGEPVVAPTPSLRRPFPASGATLAFVDARRLASARLAGDTAGAPARPWPLITLGVALAALATAASVAFRRRRRGTA
jgi:murein DD-endopeptidase MepM/ murein hydrolase activator NlpD